MEYDVIATLARAGPRGAACSGVHDDLGAIRAAIEEFKPDIVFNLLEAFADITTFDQNVVSYLELLRVPYTGCNPRGLIAGARQGALEEAAGLPPHPGARVHRRAPRPQVGAPEAAALPADREVADLRGVDRHLAGVGRRERGAAARSGCSSSTRASGRRDRRAVHRRPRALRRGARATSGCGCSRSGRCRSPQMPDDSWRIATERVKWSTQVPEAPRHQDRPGRSCREGATERIQHLAKRVYRALDLSGYARIDLRLDETGRSTCSRRTPTRSSRTARTSPSRPSARGVSYEQLLERIMSFGPAVAAGADGVGTENEERRTENGERRTKNGERRTENEERRTKNEEPTSSPHNRNARESRHRLPRFLSSEFSVPRSSLTASEPLRSFPATPNARSIATPTWAERVKVGRQ